MDMMEDFSLADELAGTRIEIGKEVFEAHLVVQEETRSALDPAGNIDEVLTRLKEIIEIERKALNPKNALFASLYLYVTAVVKATIDHQIRDTKTLNFQDNDRMADLDVIFANRYLDAYYAFKNGEPVSESWKIALGERNTDHMIPLQNILMGINAHINLDLGIATSEAVRRSKKADDMLDIKVDFNTINIILNKLTMTVEHSLADSSLLLKNLIKYGKGFESKIAGFSIEVAREAAWTFSMEHYLSKDKGKTIKGKDGKVAKYAEQLYEPNNRWVKLVIKGMKLLERKSTTQVIDQLLKDVEKATNISYNHLPEIVKVNPNDSILAID